MPIRLRVNNHIELVCRPGEAALACKALRLPGVDMATTPFNFAGATFYRDAGECLFISEVTEPQWAFEQWLQEELAAEGADATRQFLNGHRAYPQRYTHFGVGVATLAEWEETVARVQDAAANDPELKGRIGLPLVARPGDEGSAYKLNPAPAARRLYQAFFHTDVFSAGMLTIGQAVYFQHYRDHDPVWVAAEAATSFRSRVTNSPPNERASHR